MTPTQHILNTADGLDRLMGDADLYRQLLLRFRKDYQHAVAQMRQLLAEGIPVAAQRKAHSLKGAAGMIGAQELHHLAGVTEAGLGASGREVHAGLDLLERALASLLLAITSHLDETQHDAAMPAAPSSDATADARPLIERLAQLLDDGNGEAIDMLEQSATMLAASLGVAMFQEVAAAAHEFDFEAALAALAPALA
ncbi:Hpt domain-containing protein [Pseudoduganella sp. LjRoot289]|uniref:Hpt domain-containing protein n=1 Tax=Pseudoduganella sp. LjRoot289 TaxID=3342314 RepID=UPI003ED097D0